MFQLVKSERGQRHVEEGWTFYKYAGYYGKNNMFDHETDFKKEMKL